MVELSHQVKGHISDILINKEPNTHNIYTNNSAGWCLVMDTPPECSNKPHPQLSANNTPEHLRMEKAAIPSCSNYSTSVKHKALVYVLFS